MEQLYHFITSMKKSKTELPTDIYYTIAEQINNIDDKTRYPDETEIETYNSEVIIILKWKRNGVLHRDYDMPAVIKSTGELIWYNNGKISRNNKELPARIVKTKYFKSDDVYDIEEYIPPDNDIITWYILEYYKDNNFIGLNLNWVCNYSCDNIDKWL